MHNKDRKTDHQEKQACEVNMDNSWALPQGSVVKTYSERPFRRHSKTNWKTNTYKPHIQPQRTITNIQNGTHMSTTQQEIIKNIPEIKLVKQEGKQRTKGQCK